MFSFSATNMERISGLGEDSVSVSSRARTGGTQLGGHGPPVRTTGAWKGCALGLCLGFRGRRASSRPPPTPGLMACPAPPSPELTGLGHGFLQGEGPGRGRGQVWGSGEVGQHLCEAGQSRNKASLAAEVGVRRSDVGREGCQHT